MAGKMFVRKLMNCSEFTAGDHSILRELFNPLKDKMKLNYSLAHAKKHKLKTSEVYYVLQGKAIMHINEEKQEIEEGDAVYIPPESVQWVENKGKKELIILCMVEPAWKKEDETVYE